MSWVGATTVLMGNYRKEAYNYPKCLDGQRVQLRSLIISWSVAQGHRCRDNRRSLRVWACKTTHIGRPLRASTCDNLHTAHSGAHPEVRRVCGCCAQKLPVSSD